ncbi:ArnT family glycosyltransferase [Furfurilactobacillus curtus]|uniref:Mannosyltransferase YycA n=1 Tax=Furfurilactobacillus curtus TaxID=1746200 RepID=A0ABQ5JSZ3_9LACO
MRQHLKHWDWYFVLILVLAVFLYGWNIWQAGSANDFYTAAIVSMTKNWHNFWYASFDPAGFITVDKPPVALWFMAASAKLFGLHGWSIVLPSVAFGVGSVVLIRQMVRPYFGRLAGNLSAFFMTITPIVVADSRTNNMDATLIFFLLLAGFTLQRAILKRRAWQVTVAFALIGIAFNIKMLQAFMLLPAMYFFYWIASTVTWRKKVAHLIVATIALAVFTLFWPLAVDNTSTKDRPYIGSSSTNSVLNLAFGYNGSQRLLGQSTGTGSRFPGMSASTKSANKVTGKSKILPTKTNHAPNGQHSTRRPGRQGVGGGQGAFNIGTAGPFRLFQQALGEQVSWFFPLALTGLISAYLYEADHKKKWWQTTINQQQLWYWTAWLVPVAGFFSIASFFHPYYMIMLAPPLAVLAGIGVTVFIKALKNQHQLWQRYLFASGILSTGALQSWYVYSDYPWLSWLIGLGSIVATIVIITSFKAVKRTNIVSLMALILLALAPSFWSLTPTLAAESAAIPTAGPDLLTNARKSGGIGNESANQKLIKYLDQHDGNAKYLFATSDSGTAAPYIIKTGKAVMAIGGFNGTDKAISLKHFKQLVKKGEIKYFYVSGRNSNSAIVKWVQKNGTKISAKKYGGRNTTMAKSAGTRVAALRGKASTGATPPQVKLTGRFKSGRGKKDLNQKPRNANQKPNCSHTSRIGGMGGNAGTLYKLN